MRVPFAIRLVVFLTAVSFLGGPTVRGETVTTLWDESNAAQGDLSDSSASGTALGVLPVGTHRISGSLGPGESDVDVFVIEIANGTFLNSINVHDYAYPGGGTDNLAFMAFNDAAVFPYGYFEFEENYNLPFFDEMEYIGRTTFGLGDLTNPATPNGLLNAAQNTPARGYDLPMPAGTYSFYLQQTGPLNTYSLDFNVTAVPEPTSSATLGMMLVGAGTWRYQSRRYRDRTKS